MAAPSLLVRVLDRVTRPPVLTVFAALQALGLFGVSVRYLASVHGATDAAGHVVTGDFPAFYAAARMVHDGRGAALYDLAAQRAAQQALIGHTLSEFQPYAYPPLLALVLAPSAALDYLDAFRLHDVLMAAALALVLVRCWTLFPSLCATRAGAWTTALLVAGFHPVTRTVIGGQNTVLSLALLASVAASLRAGRPLLAGCFLGLLTYKPQLVPLLGLALLLRRRFTVLFAAALVAGAHYALAAWRMGLGWPLAWARMATEYRVLEWASNRYTHASLWALFAQLLPETLAQTLGATATLSVAALVAKRALEPDPSESDLFALALAGTALVSPHFQYYDVALLLLPVLQVLDARMLAGSAPSLGLRVALALGYALFPTYAYGARLGVQPLCAVSVFVFALSWSLSGSASRRKGAGGSSLGLRNTTKSAGR